MAHYHFEEISSEKVNVWELDDSQGIFGSMKLLSKIIVYVLCIQSTR